jgi:uncharacterized protein
VLGLLFNGLSIRVIRSRRDTRIPLGSGNYPSLQRAMRVHGNFAEYAPSALVLLLLAELGGISAWLLHGVGLSLFIGRAVHSYGVSQAEEDDRLRVLGMALTCTASIISALACFAIVLADIA